MPGLTPPTPINPGDYRLKPTFVNTTPPTQELSQNPVAQDPTKPWEELDYDSQLPVVPVFRPAIFDSAAPCWGFDAGFNIGDLDIGVGVKSQPIKGVAVNTQSAAISMGVQHLDIAVQISDANATCNLNIYQVDSVNGNVLMKSYVGVARLSTGLFIGGHDGIVLSGATVVIEVTNITNAATVSVTIEGH